MEYGDVSAEVKVREKSYELKGIIKKNSENGKKTVTITGLKASGASKLIKLLLDSNIIIPVSGHGKGKYRFL